MLRLLLKPFVLLAKIIRRIMKLVLLIAAVTGLLVVLDAIFGPDDTAENE